MYPDGGIARFRAYGIVQPIWLPSTAKPHPWDARPSSSKSVLGGIFGSSGERKEGEIDLAHAFNGGTCVFESDTHYGVGANLLLPGRGVDMGELSPLAGTVSPLFSDYLKPKRSRFSFR
jgi:allantoicase